MSFSIEVQFGDSRWRTARGLPARLKQAVALALKQGGAPRDATLTLLLTSDDALKALNHDFRGKNTPTNVLSFPAAGGELYLGDVALAYSVTRAEARAAGKSLRDHATHLAVHGALHLLGYDHVTRRSARAMEPLETAILAKLGIADPYAAEAA